MNGDTGSATRREPGPGATPAPAPGLAGSAAWPAGSAPRDTAVRVRAWGLAWGPAGTAIGRNLDFDAGPGQAIALMGPNGAGKTTLLRTLLGRLAPLAGEVEIDGRPVRGWPARALAQHLGYVAQQSLPISGYQALDWVLLARTAQLALGAAPGAQDLQAARAALATVGIEALADATLDTLSGGERQLVAIARALAQGGRILLLDEPCASLDFANRARVLEALGNLRRRGHALIFATHDPAEARALADRVVLLTKGGPARLLATAEAIVPSRLAEVFGVHRSVIEALGPVR